ncbi:sigma-70 family RNA polymerase sigma factor [Stieleria varia]|nr:sigma-70 family RNA polymerase sigma factor [Stieleria varia]
MSDNMDTDNPILPRIAAGDEYAVSECLEQFGGLVWSLAKRMCPADAEDATQEIFIEIWQKASTFDPSRCSEAGFIGMIARRRLIDRLRRLGRNHVTSASDEIIEVASLENVDRVELADEAAKAVDCMEKLSERQQEILTLSIHHGVSQAQISGRLGIPLGTVKSYGRRALIQLRDCMRRPAAQVEGGV